MNDTAIHLVDEVLPPVAMRQWVVTVPWALKYRFGYDRQACALLCRAFAQALFGAMRHKAKAELGLASVREAHPGAVTFVQRSDAALRLSPHLHVLSLDGVYVRDEAGKLVFHALSDPTEAEVQRLARAVVERLLRRLDLGEVGKEDDYIQEEPLLAHLYGAAASGTQVLGPGLGRAVTRLVDTRGEPMPSQAQRPGGPVLAQHEGFGVYADRGFDGRDRQRLFGMCRYLTRPPLSQKRLTELSDGRLCYRLKRTFRDGTAAVVLSPWDLLARLAALVPPPRFHLVRYAGVLSSHSALRAEVVPTAQPKPQLVLPMDAAAPKKPKRARGAGRTSWAKRLARVFKVDVTVCPTCGGPMKIVEFITDPLEVAQELGGTGMAPRAPPQAPSSQLELPRIDYVVASQSRQIWPLRTRASLPQVRMG